MIACTRPPCVRSQQAGVRYLRLLLPAGDGLHEAPAGRWRPPRGHRDGPLSSLTAHRRAQVPTTVVFFLKDVTRTPCANACEGRVGKGLVTLLRLDAHAFDARRCTYTTCSPGHVVHELRPVSESLSNQCPRATAGRPGCRCARRIGAIGGVNASCGGAGGKVVHGIVKVRRRTRVSADITI